MEPEIPSVSMGTNWYFHTSTILTDSVTVLRVATAKRLPLLVISVTICFIELLTFSLYPRAKQPLRSVRMLRKVKSARLMIPRQGLLLLAAGSILPLLPIL
jgi:hypothetical protein